MMKKLLLLLLSVCSLLLAGCSSQSSSEDSKEEKVDAILDEYEEEKVNMGMSAEWDGVNYENSSVKVAQTSEGYYFYVPTESKIMFYGKESGVALPVCTKPNCDHFITNNITIEEGKRYEHACDAAYPSNNNIQAYNGKLYADMEYLDTEGAHPLMCANLDGTNKTEVIHDIYVRKKQEEENLKNENYQISGTTVGWLIFNDKIYILTSFNVKIYSMVDRNKPETRYYVDVYDINTGDYVEELASWCDDSKRIRIEMMCAYESMLQINAYTYSADDEDENMSNDESIFYTLDVETGEKYIINPGGMQTYFGYSFLDDKVIYHKNSDNIYTIDANGQMEKCIETNDEEKERRLRIHCVGDFICTSYGSSSADGELEYLVKIYDKEYNLLETVEVPGDIFACAACDEQILLKAFNVDRFYYINTEELGTGNVELHEFSME